MPAEPALQPFVDRLLSRSRLNQAEQEALLDLPFHSRLVQSSREFVRLGEVVEQSSIVAQGLVGRFDQNAEGGRQIMAIYIPGDAPDLHSAVLPKAASALQTLAPSMILHVPHTALRGVAARFPAIAEAFWRDCAVDAAVLAQWVVNVGRRDAKARIAHLICEMATRLGGSRNEAEMEFDLPITQTHLADACGLTSVHVNRTLKDLRGGGAADFHKGRVVIKDWTKLARIGDFDPSYLQSRFRPEERLRITGASDNGS